MSDETLEALVDNLIALSPEREEETRQVIFRISQCNIEDDIVASRMFEALKNIVQNSDLQSAEIASDTLLLLVSIQAKFETSETSEFTEFLTNYLKACAHDIRYFAARVVFLNAESLEWS